MGGMTMVATLAGGVAESYRPCANEERRHHKISRYDRVSARMPHIFYRHRLKFLFFFFFPLFFCQIDSHHRHEVPRAASRDIQLYFRLWIDIHLRGIPRNCQRIYRAIL